MEKVHWKSGTLLAPLPPALVTCGDMDKHNAITIGWTGILNTHPAKTYISVRKERYSYNLIKNSGEFVINLPVEKYVKAIDYCGCRTGAKEDKIKVCGLTVERSQQISTPCITEFPINIECKVTDIIELGSHDMFMADIVGINIDASLIDSTGKLHMDKAGLCTFAHGEYFAVGKKIGDFGFSVRKKSTQKKRNMQLRNKYGKQK